eukprot:g32211.t1
MEALSGQVRSEDLGEAKGISQEFLEGTIFFPTPRKKLKPSFPYPEKSTISDSKLCQSVLRIPFLTLPRSPSPLSPPRSGLSFPVFAPNSPQLAKLPAQLPAQFSPPARASLVWPALSQKLSPNPPQSPSPKRTLQYSEQRSSFSLAAHPETLGASLWSLIWDFAGVDIHAFLSVISRVCKKWRAFQNDPEAWPMVLDVRWGRSESPTRVWNIVASHHVAVKELWLGFSSQTQIDATSAAMGNGVGQHVDRLDLTGSQVTNEGLSRIVKCFRSLTQLDLGDCQLLSDEGLKHLSSLPRLQSLDLSECVAITDAGLSHLSQLPLRRLRLDSCDLLTDTGLSHLSDMPIEYLDLWGLRRITDEGLRALSTLPLKELNLLLCTKLTSEGLAHLSTLRLNHLNLDSCARIDDQGLLHLSEMPLTYLSLHGLCRVTDEGLTVLAKLPLTHLDLALCEWLTDRSLPLLAKMPLRHLNLDSCKRLTDAGLPHLAQILSLEELNVGGCMGLTPGAVQALRAKLLRQKNRYRYCIVEGMTPPRHPRHGQSGPHSLALSPLSALSEPLTSILLEGLNQAINPFSKRKKIKQYESSP